MAGTQGSETRKKPEWELIPGPTIEQGKRRGGTISHSIVEQLHSLLPDEWAKRQISRVGNAA